MDVLKMERLSPVVSGRVKPFLKEIRSAFGPQFLVNLEKLVDATPGGRERVAMIRESMKAMRARMAAAQQAGAAR